MALRSSYTAPVNSAKMSCTQQPQSPEYAFDTRPR